MKRLSIYLLIAIMAFATACEKSNDSPLPQTEDMHLIKTIDGNKERIEIYTKNPKIKVGYTPFWIKIIDKTNQQLLFPENMSWQPMMYMPGMEHSTPHSILTKSSDTNFSYEGYVVFSMASDSESYWELNFHYENDGKVVDQKTRLEVGNLPDHAKNLQNFTVGEETYTLAMVQPETPKMGTNEISSVLLKSSGHESYEEVNGYSIEIDPRMPGMDNHSSPNNKKMTQQGNRGEYIGSLNLSMSGLWRINLILKDSDGNIIKGEAVTPENESSSLYFEFEF